LKARVEKITERPSEWIERYFYVPDPRDPVTGEFLPPGPIRLSEHQKRIINEALSKDEHGKFKYSTVIYSAPKKSGKSAIASAVTLYVAFSRPYSFVYCLANDGKQSADRIYEPIHRCMRLHKTLNGPFYKENPNKTDITLSNNTRIEAIPCDAAGEAGSQPLLSVWCFDEDTEILTKAGWKRYDQYSMEDEFLTVKSDGELEYQSPISLYVSPYSGPMYVIDTRRTSLCVTPNHKLYGKFGCDGYTLKKTEYRKLTVEESLSHAMYGFRVETHGLKDYDPVPAEVIIPATKRKPELRIPIETYLKLLGWYLAEGCTHKDNIIMLAQSKKSAYYQEIKDLIIELGYEPHEWKNTRALVFYDVRLFKHFKPLGLAHEKYIPEWIKRLPPKYVEILLGAYWRGDGYKTSDAYLNHGTLQYSTNSSRLRDDLMELAVKHGKYVTVTAYQDKRWGRPVYTVGVKKWRTGDRYIRIRSKDWQKIEYDGIIHCPTVPNGVVIVRRHGKVHAQGQSELWAFNSDAKRRLWTELSIPPTLHGYAMRWVESYAGEKGKAELLEQLYNVAVKKARPIPTLKILKSRVSRVVWVNESARLFCYWDHEPRMPWQTDDYYSEEVSYHTPSEFARIHRNEWVTPTDVFIQAEWWHSLSKNLGPISPYTPVVIGLDGAISNDYAALVGVTRDPDNNEHTAVRFCYIFTPKRSGGTIKISETVEPLLRLLCKKYNVVCVAYDKYQLEDMAQRLRKESLVWMYNFSQQTERSVADKSLYDSIINRTIWWDINGEGLPFNGEVPSLYQHITQAGAKTDGGKFRLDKLSDDAKIDAAVATSMAREMCKRLMITNKDKKTESIVRQHTRGKMTDDEFMRAVAEIR
jgi:hypothetical protein